MKVSEIGNGDEGMGWDGWIGNAGVDKTSRAKGVVEKVVDWIASPAKGAFISTTTHRARLHGEKCPHYSIPESLRLHLPCSDSCDTRLTPLRLRVFRASVEMPSNQSLGLVCNLDRISKSALYPHTGIDTMWSFSLHRDNINRRQGTFNRHGQQLMTPRGTASHQDIDALPPLAM